VLAKQRVPIIMSSLRDPWGVGGILLVFSDIHSTSKTGQPFQWAWKAFEREEARKIEVVHGMSILADKCVFSSAT